jgi:hypothetical protein
LCVPAHVMVDASACTFHISNITAVNRNANVDRRFLVIIFIISLCSNPIGGFRKIVSEAGIDALPFILINCIE